MNDKRKVFRIFHSTAGLHQSILSSVEVESQEKDPAVFTIWTIGYSQ